MFVIWLQIKEVGGGKGASAAFLVKLFLSAAVFNGTWRLKV